MKKGFYIRLAGEGISKNRKLYFPYILTCICMIMMYYIVSFLSISKELASIRGGEMLQGLLSMGVFVVAVFALIFLYYTNSFLIRKRKKELGLYNILGMGKRNLVRILLWENILTAVISLVIGIVFGILFSKLAELLAIKLLDGATGFGVHIEMKPILMTVGLFLAIFLLIMIRMLVSVYKLRPIEMLRSENVGEKPPKANWLFAFAGAVILAGAYYLAVKIIDPTTAMLVFFLAVVMVIIATYLLFIAGSVALCKLLQKSKKYYYKTRHFVSLSQMVYRMKRNGAGLASICILSTMVLVTISSTMCIYADTESSIRNRYPHDITIEWSGKTSLPQNEDGTDTELKDSVVQRLTPEMAMTYKEAVEKVLESHKVKAENLENYNLYSLSGVQSDDVLSIDFEKMKGEISSINAGMSGSVKTMYFTTMDDYNKLKGTDKTLAEDEMMLYSYKTDYEYDSFTIDGVGTWKVETMKEPPIGVGNAMANMQGSYQVVVKDLSVIEKIATAYETINAKPLQDGTLYLLSLKECYDFDLKCDEEKQIEIYKDILESFEHISEAADEQGNRMGDSLANYYADSKAYGKGDFIALNGGLFFLGVLLGAVFLFGTVLIMYYKQISEGYEDQDRFNILMKVGMTKKEVKQTINSQVLTVFFMPLIMAGIHLAFAFPMIQKILMLMSGVEAKVFVIVTIGCYLVFALFYVLVYVVTSKSYYTIISSKEK